MIKIEHDKASDVSCDACEEHTNAQYEITAAASDCSTWMSLCTMHAMQVMQHLHKVLCEAGDLKEV